MTPEPGSPQFEAAMHCGLAPLDQAAYDDSVVQGSAPPALAEIDQSIDIIEGLLQRS